MKITQQHGSWWLVLGVTIVVTASCGPRRTGDAAPTTPGATDADADADTGSDAAEDVGRSASGDTSDGAELPNDGRSLGDGFAEHVDTIADVDSDEITDVTDIADVNDVNDTQVSTDAAEGAYIGDNANDAADIQDQQPADAPAGSPDAVDAADAATETQIVCYGAGMTPGGGQMDGTTILFCAPDNSACCATNNLAVPCGWEACCGDDPPVEGVPNMFPITYACTKLPAPGPGYSKSCLTDTIPFRTCTEQRKKIIAGTLPFGDCSSGGFCCPLDPGCEPKITKQLAANPPPKVDLSKPKDPNLKCDYYKHQYAATSNSSRHLVCKPGDKACCWVLPPFGAYAPCGYDFCCQKDPSLPYGLTEANLTCAEFDKLPQPICLNNGTARYRHCNPTPEVKAKAGECGTLGSSAENSFGMTVCCNGASPGCAGQPSVPMPKAWWEK